MQKILLLLIKHWAIIKRTLAIAMSILIVYFIFGYIYWDEIILDIPFVYPIIIIGGVLFLALIIMKEYEKKKFK